MALRRMATLILLLCLNLILGVLYMQPSKIRTLIKAPVYNDTEPFTDNPLMVLDIDKTFTNTSTNFTTDTINTIKKITTESYATESAFPIFYNFTMNPRDLCSRNSKSKSKISLFVLVCSAIPNFKQRQTIRETWGSIALSNNNTGFVRLAFLLGSINNATLQEQLEKEFYHYGDIIQQNFNDSYQNLTLKSIMLLRWVNEFCPNVQYVLKTDDDMYVNVVNLQNMLVRLPVKSNVMYGVLFKKAKPNRNPAAKWFVPKHQFDGSIFPDYLSGTGYVMSRDVVPKLLDASNVVPFLVMEDVFITGLCASESRVKRYNVRGFAYWKRPATGCAFKDVITGHHVSIIDMIKIWKELQKKPLLCRQIKKKS